MLELFLTSSPFSGHEDPADDHTDSEGRSISPVNGLEEKLKKSAGSCRRGLFITSDPDNAAFTDGFSGHVRDALKRSGISPASWTSLDRRNASAAGKLVLESDLIVLAGGHTPTQNHFFREIGLRELLRDRASLPAPAVLLGISAGSMNAADLVYAQPEEEGESLDPGYERFLPGLGLTDLMIIPHYQRIRDRILDGKRLFEDISAPDSKGRCFYLFSDGTYLHIKGNLARICGELHVMKDGQIRKIASHGGVTALIS